jgi:hypothetical protein
MVGPSWSGIRAGISTLLLGSGGTVGAAWRDPWSGPCAMVVPTSQNDRVVISADADAA